MSMQRFETLLQKYGLFPMELTLLLDLNDAWFFTFEEFSEILSKAPKTYSTHFTRQRLLDSLEWLDYIELFRVPWAKPPLYFDGDTWKEFILTNKKMINAYFPFL
jgi:hypothetical protein